MGIAVSRAGTDLTQGLTMPDVDVAIVGAGPAGSVTAIALARRGYEVALLDKKSFPRDKLCGDFINPINLPVLRDLGVDQQVFAQPHAEVTGFRITASSGHAAEAQFSSADQQSAIGFGLRRSALDQTLVERAAELGVTLRLGWRIEELSQSARGWEIKSAAESWRAKILVGADGRNSWVAQRLAMNKPASMRGRSVGFQFRLRCRGAAPGKVEIHLFPGGYAGLIRLGDGELNLCLSIDREKLPSESVAEFLLTQCLPQNPYLKAVLEQGDEISQFRSAYPVYYPKRRCYADRAVLVGDAARVTEPVTGEGIYFAMQSGLLAAETIDTSLIRGDLSANYLRRYKQRCNQAFRARAAFNSLMRLVIYRSALLDLLIPLCARDSRMLNSLVGAICTP